MWWPSFVVGKLFPGVLHFLQKIDKKEKIVRVIYVFNKKIHVVDLNERWLLRYRHRKFTVQSSLLRLPFQVVMLIAALRANKLAGVHVPKASPKVSVFRIPLRILTAMAAMDAGTEKC
jgi:hypothetical protein